MLDIITFDAQGGGNILYKALAHPLASEALRDVAATLAESGAFAVYDPENMLQTLVALYPEFAPQAGVYTHDTEQVGLPDGFGGQKLALTDLSTGKARAVLALSFEQEKMRARLSRVTHADQRIVSLEPAKLPERMLTNTRAYLDKQNFATNFAFFRDDERFSTRLVTANYWCNYDATDVRYWMRLFDGDGAILAEWEHEVPDAPAGIVVDSAEIRERFGLPSFCGQLFIHVLGARGHDVVKYALDIYGKNGEKSLSVTHDANAWPSPRFATLPAPREDERLVLWVQNSHATPIPAGAITLNEMGEDTAYPVPLEIAPFATYPLDVGALAPGIVWPAQFELRSGNHVVRPRYEITQGALTRIAHLNVERRDLKPEPALRALPPSMGRGFVLPFPVLDPARFTTVVQPNPMSEQIHSLPLRIDVFDEAGALVSQRFLGNLPRNHHVAVALHELTDRPGHADLVYDFRDGGDGDGWLHAMMRYESRETDHAAETSFGGHIFNTLMTWRSEPQSYAGPPPGLTTRLFLKLGQEGHESFSCLIHPASVEGTAPSETVLHLYAHDGVELERRRISINPSGSYMVWPHEIFGPEKVAEAGIGGYVLIRDLSCRLFGYHGQRDARGGFSLDHMFGF
ncbi:hypothetical protein [Swaminathania salitolerans]|uniref:Uncharacterized protein n=1 Tax=Swaminathania salitolerans TaxID=182838 RepID=A0A511BN12_9PROT|nr:hypothetical protein [Swaminathania salitolerans]GBQ13863.1 hypothetical protein AA21291_1646 [Swaminathania salitolerans LMG 21291]GEL01711.1 hypothetical protein SSA02_08740 [Swaminathania salitolerans]